MAAAEAGGGKAARGPPTALNGDGLPKPRGGPTNCVDASAAGSVPFNPMSGVLRPRRRLTPLNFALLQSTADWCMWYPLGEHFFGGARISPGAVLGLASLDAAAFLDARSRSGAAKPATSTPVWARTAVMPSELGRRLRSSTMEMSCNSSASKQRGGRGGPKPRHWCPQLRGTRGDGYQEEEHGRSGYYHYHQERGR